MILVKSAISLTLIIVFMFTLFKAWRESTEESLTPDSKFWTYFISVLAVFDVLCIAASVIWFLFWY